MGYYDDHINAVKARFEKRYKESGLAASEFVKSAKVTLKGYGWNEQEVQRILSGIK